MKKFLDYLKSRFTMKFKETLFVDRCNGRYVCLYEDCFNKLWMAQSKYGFRTMKGSEELTGKTGV